MGLTITVDLNKKCAECKQGGAVANGLCMGCTTKAIKGKRMKSAEGAVVAARIHAIKREFRR